MCLVCARAQRRGGVRKCDFNCSSPACISSSFATAAPQAHSTLPRGQTGVCSTVDRPDSHPAAWRNQSSSNVRPWGGSCHRQPRTHSCTATRINRGNTPRYASPSDFWERVTSNRRTTSDMLSPTSAECSCCGKRAGSAALDSGVMMRRRQGCATEATPCCCTFDSPVVC